MNKQQKVAAYIAAALVALGTLLPWVTVIVLGSVSVNGIDTSDGKIVLALAAVVALTIALAWRWMFRAASLALLGLSSWDLWGVLRAIHNTPSDPSTIQVHAVVGTGLWLCVAAGFALVVTAGVDWRNR